MLWVTWRQSRTAAISAGAALVALAATLAITRPGMLSLYSDAGLPSCHADCAADASTFINSVKGTSTETIFYAGIVIMYLVPALIGLFWGAPLIARELESGTFRLAWNQSVTRQQWAALKLALVGGATLLTTFALGSTIGVLLRRTLPAMAVTLAVFAAVQLLVPTLVRPHLVPPAQSTQALASAQFSGIGITNSGHLVMHVSGISGRPADWIISSRPVDGLGRTVLAAPAACRSLSDEFFPCLTRHGVRLAVSYQPAGRYWELQSVELAMYLVAAAALGGLCYWRVRRPVAAP